MQNYLKNKFIRSLVLFLSIIFLTESCLDREKANVLQKAIEWLIYEYTKQKAPLTQSSKIVVHCKSSATYDLLIQVYKNKTPVEQITGDFYNVTFAPIYSKCDTINTNFIISIPYNTANYTVVVRRPQFLEPYAQKIVSNTGPGQTYTIYYDAGAVTHKFDP